MPPPVTQRGNKKPLVTIEDDKGPFVAVRFRKPLLYPTELRGHDGYDTEWDLKSPG